MGAKRTGEEPITGTVKSIDGDIVTVVYKDQNGKKQEIDVPGRAIGKSALTVGEVVSVEFSRLTVETKIPITGSMLEIEDAIKDALGLLKDDLLEKAQQATKKVPAKRPKKT